MKRTICTECGASESCKQVGYNEYKQIKEKFGLVLKLDSKGELNFGDDDKIKKELNHILFNSIDFKKGISVKQGLQRKLEDFIKRLLKN